MYDNDNQRLLKLTCVQLAALGDLPGTCTQRPFQELSESEIPWLIIDSLSSGFHRTLLFFVHQEKKPGDREK